jgi:hypothetical protein
MVYASDILFYIKTILFVLIITAFVVYSLPIIFIPRFRIRYNILTLNLCLATLCCVLCWCVYETIAQFNTKLLFRDSTCGFLLYMVMMCLCQASFSNLNISVIQLCDIVYHRNQFFRTNRWLVICIGIQWSASIILSVPGYSRVRSVRHFLMRQLTWKFRLSNSLVLDEKK